MGFYECVRGLDLASDLFGFGPLAQRKGISEKQSIRQIRETKPSRSAG